MARDRKRAKQRKARGSGGRPGNGRPESSNDREDEHDSTLVPPDPIEHAAPDAELAEAQVAAGRPPADEAGDAEAAEAQDESEDGASAPVRRVEPEGNRVVAFARGSWRELQRVQWPDRRQVAQATGVVLGFVVIAGAFLGLADIVAQKLVDAIL
jgi:preprotein translocase SecE subunit